MLLTSERNVLGPELVGVNDRTEYPRTVSGKSPGPRAAISSRTGMRTIHGDAQPECLSRTAGPPRPAGPIDPLLDRPGCAHGSLRELRPFVIRPAACAFGVSHLLPREAFDNLGIFGHPCGLRPSRIVS